MFINSEYKQRFSLDSNEPLVFPGADILLELKESLDLLERKKARTKEVEEVEVEVRSELSELSQSKFELEKKRSFKIEDSPPQEPQYRRMPSRGSRMSFRTGELEVESRQSLEKLAPPKLNIQRQESRS